MSVRRENKLCGSCTVSQSSGNRDLARNASSSPNPPRNSFFFVFFFFSLFFFQLQFDPVTETQTRFYNENYSYNKNNFVRLKYQSNPALASWNFQRKVAVRYSNLHISVWCFRTTRVTSTWHEAERKFLTCLTAKEETKTFYKGRFCLGSPPVG